MENCGARSDWSTGFYADEKDAAKWLFQHIEALVSKAPHSNVEALTSQLSDWAIRCLLYPVGLQL